jgi:hypothetical protein
MTKPWTVSRGPIAAADIDIQKAEAINALLFVQSVSSLASLVITSALSPSAFSRKSARSCSLT